MFEHYSVNNVLYFKLRSKIINYKNDYSIDDESISFCINYNYNEKSIPVIFNSLDERKFSLIELDLFFDTQRFRIFDFYKE